MTDPGPLLLDLRAAAERLRVSFGTVRRLVDSGALTSVKVRARRLVPADQFAHCDQDEAGVVPLLDGLDARTGQPTERDWREMSRQLGVQLPAAESAPQPTTREEREWAEFSRQLLDAAGVQPR